MAETDETYSAKQIASRIGTDAKTFRKWLRSSASPYKAVGQGQRYEFPKTDLQQIKTHFDAWKAKSARKVAPLNGHTVKLSELDPPAGRVPTKKLSGVEFQEELKARGKARDEEYGTIDGEEPTREELEALIENNELPSDDELEELEDH